MSGPPWDYIAKLVCIGDSGTGKSSLTIRLCEGRFTTTHDVTIGVEFGSRIVPVGPPASDALGIDFDNDSPSQQIPVAPTSPTDSTEPSTNNTAVNGNDTPGQKQQRRASGLPAPPKKPAADKSAVQKRMKLSLWDTAGQETYKSITRSYFRGASGALLVFDITRPSTFASLTQWLQDLQQIAEEGIVIILVGNKNDLSEDDNTESNDTTNTDKDGDNDNDNSKKEKEGANRRRVTREEAEEWCRANNIVRYVETSAKSGDGVERAFCEVAERIYRNIQQGRYDLNDRRSGVKGFGATSGGRDGRVPRPVTLGVNDAMRRGGGGWSGGCC